jgi:hypothetical protein
MEKDLSHLDLVSLLDLYNTELESLNKRLLSGESWEAVSDQRKIVTKLASIIHKKEPHLDLLKLNVPGELQPGSQPSKTES